MEVCQEHECKIETRFNRTNNSNEKFCPGCKSIPRYTYSKEQTLIDQENNKIQDEDTKNTPKNSIDIKDKNKLKCDKHPEQKLTYHFNRTQNQGQMICTNPECKRVIGNSNNFDE